MVNHQLQQKKTLVEEWEENRLTSSYEVIGQGRGRNSESNRKKEMMGKTQMFSQKKNLFQMFIDLIAYIASCDTVKERVKKET